MNTTDWEILIALAKEKNMTRVAEALFLSQPTLSYRLRKLESEFNVPLFYRTRSGFYFTPEGEKLAQYADEMRKHYYQIQETLLGMRSEVQGTLRIGVTSAFANYVLPTLLHQFCLQYPKVEINMKSKRSSEIYSELENGDFNVAIVRGSYTWPEKKILLCREPVCLVSQAPIAIRDLPNMPQIIAPKTGIHSDTLRWWEETFRLIPSKVAMEVDNMETALQMVLQGMGWSIFPQIFCNGHETLYRSPLVWKDGSAFQRDTWILCRDVVYETILTSTFINYIMDHTVCTGTELI